jgi:hypothetical protein
VSPEMMFDINMRRRCVNGDVEQAEAACSSAFEDTGAPKYEFSCSAPSKRLNQ